MVEQLRPGDAEQEQRRVPSEIGDVVDEVEERRLGPLEVVEDENEWLLSCHPLEDAAGLQGDLVPVGPEVDLAGERLDLGERPVRDPLPVGQAATGEQRCVDAVLELSNEPRLPDPGGSEQRELVGNSLGDGMVVGALELGELVFPADQGRVESARDELRALDETDEPERCDRFRLPLGVQWDRQAPPRLRLERAGAWMRRAASRPDAAPCSSRAATLTASPTASVWPSPATTSPVLTPMRLSIRTPQSRSSSSLSSANAARMSAAARTARKASSSCTTGTPNTAMTASPMNFSTVPPWRSIASRIASK